MSESPRSTNGDNGRGPGGRFAVGNRGGPGNPHSAKVARLRSTLLTAVTQKDMRAIVRKLVGMSIAGDVPAARVLLDRALGPSIELDILQRLEILEAAAERWKK